MEKIVLIVLELTNHACQFILSGCSKLKKLSEAEN